MATGGTVVVAGAGVSGLCAALALARSGVSVTVCDPAPLGHNASGVAAGMLAPAFEAALDIESRPHADLLFAARDRWSGLARFTGVSIDRSGALARGRTQWLDQAAAALAAIGAPVSVTAEGLFTAEDWRLEPDLALAALRFAAEEAGVRFRETQVAAFTPGEARLADGGRLGADRLVVATGVERGLAPEQAALTPIKGHILRLPVVAGGPVVRGEGVYLCPSIEGLVVGATMEIGRADTLVEQGRVVSLLEKAEGLLPGISGSPVEAQAGVRAATPDGLPLVGPSAADGVILAVGMRRNGWLLGPLVGEMVAAYAVGGEPGPWAGALDSRRFGNGDLGDLGNSA